MNALELISGLDSKERLRLVSFFLKEILYFDFILTWKRSACKSHHIALNGWFRKGTDQDLFRQD